MKAGGDVVKNERQHIPIPPIWTQFLHEYPFDWCWSFSHLTQLSSSLLFSPDLG